jgi:hypothetical protein
MQSNNSQTVSKLAKQCNQEEKLNCLKSTLISIIYQINSFEYTAKAFTMHQVRGATATMNTTYRT